ncbi:MAG: aminodeoxychorismate synthase component I [Betaproteobacteria bacterium]
MPAPRSTPTALIDFRSPDAGVAPMRLAFGQPRECLRAITADQVAPLLARVDALARGGAWCVGYLCYEASAAFDEAFETHAPADPTRPLAAFAIHDALLADFDTAATPLSEAADVRWTRGPQRGEFDATIAEILRAIADGEVYQVNATAPLTGTMQGDPLALFAALRRAQPHAYAAFLDFGDGDDRILSVSPELFFDWRGDRLLARPMKGTAPRGANDADDAAQSQFLRTAPKERAENLMIVDLLRNDLSRIAEPFSVRVPRLFHTEAWPTVWQMSSDVVATTRLDTSLCDVFGALFPCGSITGAPKVQAMRLIRELEPEPRGIYCGAIGVVQPGGAATFNVPIRTLALRDDAGTVHVRCGIGSGITADATAAGEWDEWRHKRAFVDRASQAFELLETLRLEEGAFVDLEAHLARMDAAARHFAFAPPLSAAREALAALRDAHPRGRWRVRLLADRAGHARAQAFALAPTPVPVRVRLATRPLVGTDGEFVRFKTTHRTHYDAFTPVDADVFDTLLWNERGELTEFTRGNVALRIDGRWLTPSLSSGLLPGIARAVLLADGTLQEAVLTRDDLARCDGLAFFNSLRGWLDAEL